MQRQQPTHPPETVRHLAGVQAAPKTTAGHPLGPGHLGPGSFLGGLFGVRSGGGPYVLCVCTLFIRWRDSHTLLNFIPNYPSGQRPGDE